MTELFLIFLRLGLVGFGGPIALIALMEQELCKKRQWFSLDEFTQVYGICKLLPGPVAIQTAIYLGYKKHGRLGGFLAGTAMTLPALIMMFILSFLYVKYSNADTKLGIVSNFMQNAALAIIVLVTLDLAKAYIKNLRSVIILLIASILIFYAPTFEPLIIIGFGLLGLTVTFKPKANLAIIPIIDSSTWQGLYGLFSNPKVLLIFWICFKASEFIFGTGLAIIPLLHGEFVQNLHWMTNKQFIDGITLGQITPGPVSVSVVFFGYTVSGFPGAIAATLGFYIPPLINTLIILPLVWNKIIYWEHLDTFSLWAFPAIIGGIAGASVKIGMSSLVNVSGWIILIVSLTIAYKKLLPAWLLIPIAGLIGIVVAYF